MDQMTICNLALDAVGTRSTIASLTEGTAESDAIALHYDPARLAILQAARWNFSRRQGLLTLLADATQGQSVASPWLYKYAYPSDCVQGRFVFPTVFVDIPSTTVGTPSAISAVGPQVRFLIGMDVDQSGNQIQVILTNQSQATFVYTGDVTNTALFDAQFVEAFRTYLGARVCMRLTGDKQLAMALFKQADSLCTAAAASNGNEGLTIIDSIPDWMKVRGYASDWGYPDGGYFSYGPQSLSPIQ